MQQKIKSEHPEPDNWTVNGVASWFDSPCYYVCVGFGGKQMGLLVETDDEDEAWREAEDLCQSFGEQARTLYVRKVTLQ